MLRHSETEAQRWALGTTANPQAMVSVDVPTGGGGSSGKRLFAKPLAKVGWMTGADGRGFPQSTFRTKAAMMFFGYDARQLIQLLSASVLITSLLFLFIQSVATRRSSRQRGASLCAIRRAEDQGRGWRQRSAGSRSCPRRLWRRPS